MNHLVTNHFQHDLNKPIDFNAEVTFKNKLVDMMQLTAHYSLLSNEVRIYISREIYNRYRNTIESVVTHIMEYPSPIRGYRLCLI